MLSTHHKDVIVFRGDEGGKVVQITIKMRDVLGALADSAGRVSKAGVNVLEGHVSRPLKDGYGYWSFFALLPDTDLSAGKLTALLKKSKYIQDVRIGRGEGGLIVDTDGFPLDWNTSDRAIMLRTGFFTLMEETARKVFSTGGDTFLYELGFNHGLPTWENLFKTFKVKGKKDLDYALKIYQAVGWCQPRVLSYDPNSLTAEVRVDNNFECESEGPQRPRSHFVRGHFAGALTALFGTRMKCLETKCIAAGHGFCVFQLSRA